MKEQNTASAFATSSAREMPVKDCQPSLRRNGISWPRAFQRPPWRDPRWIFAGLLSAYAVAGFTVLGFNRDPLQVFLTVLACVGLDFILARMLRGEWIFPLSAYITGLGLSLLVNYPHDYFLLFFRCFLPSVPNTC